MERFLFLLVDGLNNGAVLGLVTFGFALALAVTDIFHFAHGAVFVWAMYVVYFFHVTAGLPYVVAVVATAVVAGALAVLISEGVYAPIRRRSRQTLPVVAAAFGALIVLENVALLVWGPDLYVVGNWGGRPYAVIFGVPFLPSEVYPFVISAAVLALCFGFLRLTRTGRGLRATGSNPMRAEFLGISRTKSGIVAFALGGAALAPAALMTGLTSGVTPSGGEDLVLVAGVATIAAGMGRVWAAVAIAVAVGVIEDVSTIWISSVWETTVTFCLLVAVVIFQRPQWFARTSPTALRGG